MEAILKSLVESGPVGVLAALEALAIGVLFVQLRASQKDLTDEIRRSAVALSQSTEAIQEATAARKAGTEALTAVANYQNLILGRVERIVALCENSKGR